MLDKLEKNILKFIGKRRCEIFKEIALSENKSY